MESATEKIFTCDACKYTFSAAKYEKRCPDCGKLQVRSASLKEIDDYIKIQMEIVQAENHILWRNLLALVFVMSSNIFNITVENVA